MHSISAVSKSGDSVVAVVPPQTTQLAGLSLDDAYVYYWQGATIVRARKDGTSSPPETLATASAQGVALGVDGTSISRRTPVF